MRSPFPGSNHLGHAQSDARRGPNARSSSSKTVNATWSLDQQRRPTCSSGIPWETIHSVKSTWTNPSFTLVRQFAIHFDQKKLKLILVSHRRDLKNQVIGGQHEWSRDERPGLLGEAQNLLKHRKVLPAS